MSKQTDTTHPSQTYDVIINGGGMVGAAVALGLEQQGFKVALLERQAPELTWSPKHPYETRVSALTRASEQVLRGLEAWQGIEQRRLHAFVDMHVCETSGSASVHFSAKEVGEPNLGYVVENHVIQSALWAKIEAHSQITCVLADELVGLDFHPDGVEANLASGMTLSAKLVVGADGAFSKVRQLAGIGLDTHEYGQCAVVGCVKTQLSHQDACWQKYNADGPFAFLAMDNNVSSIAWYLPIEKMAWAQSLDDSAFAKAITQASGEMLGQVIEVSERAAFPLVRRHAQHYVKSNLVLVGDAAHTIHPQAGQGVNLGLLDAAALIEVLTDAKQEAPNYWYSKRVLRRYERWRRGDNALVQRSMEVFDSMFKPQAGVKQQLRQVALNVADQLTPAKHWLMLQALNGRGEMPVLAKGKTIQSPLLKS